MKQSACGTNKATNFGYKTTPRCERVLILNATVVHTLLMPSPAKLEGARITYNTTQETTPNDAMVPARADCDRWRTYNTKEASRSPDAAYRTAKIGLIKATLYEHAASTEDRNKTHGQAWCLETIVGQEYNYTYAR
jgi:hypothetical protein